MRPQATKFAGPGPDLAARWRQLHKSLSAVWSSVSIVLPFEIAVIDACRVSALVTEGSHYHLLCASKSPARRLHPSSPDVSRHFWHASVSAALSRLLPLSTHDACSVCHIFHDALHSPDNTAPHLLAGCIDFIRASQLGELPPLHANRWTCYR